MMMIMKTVPVWIMNEYCQKHYGLEPKLTGSRQVDSFIKGRSFNETVVLSWLESIKRRFDIIN